MLSGLSERTRNVVCDRYGLWDGISETLEDIGNKLGVTRERIRQIEGKGLKRLHRVIGPILPEFIRIKLTQRMTSEEGVLSEEEIVEAFADDCSLTEASAALGLMRDLHGQSDMFGHEFAEVEPSVYAASAESAGQYKRCVSLLHAILADLRRPLDEAQLWEQVILRSTGVFTPSRKLVQRTLNISPSFHVLSNGTVVLSRVMNAKRGRVITLCEEVLERLGRPAHFSEIAKKINNLDESVRKLSEGTIHNVLISRREVFVWVKNGTYGLASWGLKQPPSIKERLVQILSEHTYPIAYWFLKEKTLEVCNCRETSVRMTLDLNPRIFKKFDADQYALTSKFSGPL